MKATRFRLGLVIWIAGMSGIIAQAVLLVPQLLKTLGAPVQSLPPFWVLSLASVGQNGVLLALVVWMGTTLSGRIGLHAPGVESALDGSSIGDALRRQLWPGVAGGVLGGVILVLFVRYAPRELAAAQARLNAPLVVRLLYGGITEEVLLRWGFMTLLLWLAWRFLQSRMGEPKETYAWAAIVLSSVVFGAGHLPLAVHLAGHLSLLSVAFVLAANGFFGIIAGFLFLRSGLEAAIVAHMVAHLVNYAAGKF